MGRKGKASTPVSKIVDGSINRRVSENYRLRHHGDWDDVTVGWRKLRNGERWARQLTPNTFKIEPARPEAEGGGGATSRVNREQSVSYLSSSFLLCKQLLLTFQTNCSPSVHRLKFHDLAYAPLR